MTRRPFLTGSHAYGTPTETSDVNMVTLVSEIWELAPTLHIGQLSVTLVFSEAEYDAWQVATNRMIDWKLQGFPVPKEQAIKEVQKELTLAQLADKVPFG